MRRSLALTSALIAALALLPNVGGRPAKAPRTARSYVKLDPVLGLTDGKGHYFLLQDPLSRKRWSNTIFYGTKKKMFLQNTQAIYADPNTRIWSAGILDPRAVEADHSSLARDKRGSIAMVCGKRRTQLTALTALQAQKLLKQAKRYSYLLRHESHLLARDDQGRYFYVDRLWGRDPLRGNYRGFRFWIGKLGQMKRQRLRNIVSDDAGELLLTGRGTLKLTPLPKARARWLVKGKPAVALTIVPASRRTRVLIFRSLGVYPSRYLGHPCDDF
jgi:hypothetical protein